MLQYISKNRKGYQAAEEAARVIEGGCRWIEIDMPEESDEYVKKSAMEMIDACREHDAFLIIRDHIDVVDDLKVSGIHISDPKEISKTRERLGANAVVGVSVQNPEEVIILKGKDSDYVTVKDKSPLEMKEFVENVRKSGMKDIAIVAEGNITLDNLEEYINSGVNGIAISSAIADSDDPMLYTSQIMEKLLNIK